MVYVDEAIHPWRGKLWAHLIADELQELHDFAAKLGLKRKWLQKHRVQLHYDITEAKRKEAIAKGATPITTEEMAKRVVSILKERSRS